MQELIGLLKNIHQIEEKRQWALFHRLNFVTAFEKSAKRRGRTFTYVKFAGFGA